MPDDNKAMQEQQIHAAPIHVEEQEEVSIRAQLSALQNWDLAEGQTLEERREEQAQRIIQEERTNYALSQAAHQQLRPATANATAPGQPQQLQAPAKQTFKEKQAAKKKMKEVRKHSSTGDLDTYEMVHTLKDLRAERLNSMTTKRFEDAVVAGVDSRVLTVFCDGYRTDKKGNPATPRDQQKKNDDNAFLDAYLSNDVKRREPFLKDITNSILKLRLNPEVLNQSYVKKNLSQLKNAGDQLCYFENIYKDPINKPFFDGLTELERQLINVQLDSASRLTGALTNILAIKGVGLSSNDYVDGDQFIEDNVAQSPMYQEYFREGLQAQREGLETAVSQALDAELVAHRAALIHESDLMKLEPEAIAETYSDSDLAEMLARAEDMKLETERAASLNEITSEEKDKQLEDARKLKAEAGRLTELREYEGLNLTAYITGYSLAALSDTRRYIENNPPAYQEKKGLMDRLYQEMYRAVDALGDNVLESRALQDVVDDHLISNTYSDRLFLTMVYKRQEGLVSDASLMRNYMNAMQDVAQHLMRGKRLSEPAQRLLERWDAAGAAGGPNPEA